MDAGELVVVTPKWLCNRSLHDLESGGKIVGAEKAAVPVSEHFGLTSCSWAWLAFTEP